MADLDPRHLALLIAKDEPSVFKDYVNVVANDGLLPYKHIIQYGKKAGESLYVHVLNGIFVLEQLRPALDLGDVETRVLFTAFTIHDLNKTMDDGRNYGQLAIGENVVAEIERLKLDRFFPAYEAYVEDVTTLMRAHSAHHHHDGASLIRSYDPYGLGRERVEALKHLVRAADAVDLSHTLDERSHKDDFLFHLNTFSDVQYEFCRHAVTEDRGLLSNVIHEGIVAHLRDELDLIPLLFYPDGVAYLVPRGRDLQLTEDDLTQIGQRIAAAISAMTSDKLPDFVESKPGGIKIMPKCLDLGLPFADIWRVAFSRVQTRNLDAAGIAKKARGRAERYFEKYAQAYPEAAEEVRAMLASDEPLTAMDEGTLRLGELTRAYYIFVKEYFSDVADDPWHYVYELLEIPESRWPVYEYFSGLWDRAYVLARDIELSEETLYRRFEADGTRLLSQKGDEDPKAALFTEYVRRYVIFSFQDEGRPAFSEHLAHYVEGQHKQCVTCSSTMPTGKWMAGDVRDDITVQAFSNRLRGGPGDPKKHVCALCRVQFLLEKLNYPPVRGEKIIYLHLLPYAFLTAPFIQGLRTGINRLTRENLVERALFLRTADAVRVLGGDKPLHLDFTGVTRDGRSQYYGLYLPRYSATVGNRLIFPLNPAGQNDTERFLFALWNGMLLQKHFGCKVLLTSSPVAPLDKEDFHDLYVANAPLACRGLVRENDYAAYRDGTDRPGTLPQLWEQVHHLFDLSRLVRSADTRRNEQVALVQAMGDAPMAVFYSAEKLMEARVSDREWPLIRLSQRAFPHVSALVKSIECGKSQIEFSGRKSTLATEF
ncbi:MAG TPA: type I-D CRISPR-associated protein Cas10d/Csc3, partial [Chloroflexi bacterium]|nr:type I-D CRISPR-associated protein Cas10d/Csc3 [Chloroflexota bacterium]